MSHAHARAYPQHPPQHPPSRSSHAAGPSSLPPRQAVDPRNLIEYAEADDEVYVRRYHALKHLVYALEDENNMIAFKLAQTINRCRDIEFERLRLGSIRSTNGNGLYGNGTSTVQPGNGSSMGTAEKGERTGTRRTAQPDIAAVHHDQATTSRQSSSHSRQVSKASKARPSPRSRQPSAKTGATGKPSSVSALLSEEADLLDDGVSEVGQRRRKAASYSASPSSADELALKDGDVPMGHVEDEDDPMDDY